MIWCRNPRTSPVSSNFLDFWHLISNWEGLVIPSVQAFNQRASTRNVYLFSVAKIQILEDLNCRFSKKVRDFFCPDKSKTVRDLASKPYGRFRHSGRRICVRHWWWWSFNAICHQRPDLSSGVTGMRLAPVPGKMGKITETHQEARPAVIIHHSSFIVHPSSFIVHPSSFIVHRSSFIIHDSSFIVHRSSFIIHHSSFIVHPSSLLSLIFFKMSTLTYLDPSMRLQM